MAEGAGQGEGDLLIAFPNLYTMEEVGRLIIITAFNLCTGENVGEFMVIILLTEFTCSGLRVTSFSYTISCNVHGS